MRPNVLVVVFDAARRDSLEPYGAPAGASPAVAQLASRGTAFPEVYATACWTAPSHASIFTGLLPRAAGLARVPGGAPSGARPVLEAQRDRLLPEVLRRAGYATGAVSANLWLSEASGFAIGFDEFRSVDSGRQSQLHGDGLGVRLRWAREALRARVDDGAAAVERVFESWLGQVPSRPFFWFVNLIECHSPYLPPRPYGGLSLVDRLRAAEDARRYYTLDAIWRACVGGYDVPEATIERMRRFYAASIRYMDDWLARLLERLDAAGVLDETLVIVTADHGENFGEGGFLAHAMSLDNRLIHVPFVAAGPGARDGSISSLAQLPPFVAGAAGLEEHPWHHGSPPGVGVAQFEPPVGPDDPRAAEALVRWGLGEEALHRFTTPMTCAVSGSLKLLRRGEEELVYDLAADPLELAPIPASEADPGALASLRDALEHPSVTASEPPSGEMPAAPEEASADELRELEDRMRMLGYM